MGLGFFATLGWSFTAILHQRFTTAMDVKLIMVILTGLFLVSALFFGTKNGFYDTDKYDGNGSAH